MEKIIIGCIVGGMYGLAIALYKNSIKSSKFSDPQSGILFFLIIFPPLLYIIYFIMLIFNEVSFSRKPEVKKLKKSTNEINNLNEARQKLEQLRRANILTEKEFQEKKIKIASQINDQVIINTHEYINLKSLLDNNVLSKMEFDEKVKILTKQFIDDYGTRKPIRIIKDVKFIKKDFTVEMGKIKEYHIIIEDGKRIKIFEKLSDYKTYCYSGKEMLMFDNKNLCVDYIAQRI